MNGLFAVATAGVASRRQGHVQPHLSGADPDEGKGGAAAGEDQEARPCDMVQDNHDNVM